MWQNVKYVFPVFIVIVTFTIFHLFALFSYTFFVYSIKLISNRWLTIHQYFDLWCFRQLFNSQHYRQSFIAGLVSLYFTLCYSSFELLILAWKRRETLGSHCYSPEGVLVPWIFGHAQGEADIIICNCLLFVIYCCFPYFIDSKSVCNYVRHELERANS